MKKLLAPILVCLIFTGALGALHFSFPSLVNNLAQPYNLTTDPADDELMEKLVRLHSVHPAFVGRPLTTWLISKTQAITDFAFGQSFALVNFGLLFLVGLLIFYLAKQYGSTNKSSFLSLAIFYLSFSIIFAFFRSIDTWDEPLQYLFVLLSLVALHKKQFFFFSLSILGALVARETTLILFPAFLYLLLPRGYNFKKINFRIFFLLIPLGCYCILLYYLFKQGVAPEAANYFLETRFTHLSFNFQSAIFAIESLVSMFAVLALPVLLAWRYWKSKKIDASQKKLLVAFLITVMINTPIVVLAARAREARLFALPLVFLWPLLGTFLLATIKKISLSWKSILISIIGIALAYLLAFQLFEPTHAAGFEFGFQLYIFLLFSLLSIWISESTSAV